MYVYIYIHTLAGQEEQVGTSRSAHNAGITHTDRRPEFDDVVLTASHLPCFSMPYVNFKWKKKIGSVITR